MMKKTTNQKTSRNNTPPRRLRMLAGLGLLAGALTLLSGCDYYTFGTGYSGHRYYSSSSCDYGYGGYSKSVHVHKSYNYFKPKHHHHHHHHKHHHHSHSNYCY